MVLANENYLKAQEANYFEEIEKRVNAYKVLHPNEKILRLGTIEPSLPLSKEVVSAMHKAVDDLSNKESYKGYAPIQGYDFLIEKILKEYRSFGVSLDKECIFVNNGSTSDLGNIMHILGLDNIIAIADTIDPTYQNTTVLSGRAGTINEEGKWGNLVYLKCDEKTDFRPQLPTEKVDIIFISNPNNVTGTGIDRAELKRWVEYAQEQQSLIIYDASFQAFVKNPDIPKSIYEIKGAKKVAIEVRSYSKNAGFSGVRCGFTVFPTDLYAYTLMGKEVSLNKLWKKRISSYTNGVSYVSQRAAEATYSRKGKTEISDNINYYMINTSLIREELHSFGWDVYGGQDSPFVWFKIPTKTTSWKYFHQLLYEHGIIGTPGIVFGPSNDGFMRFSGFCDRNDITLALSKLKKGIIVY